MSRSFTDRVLGGVCGGLSAVFPINAWWFRLLFVLLTLLSGGGFGLLYLMLWWILPLEWPVRLGRGGSLSLFFALLLTLLTVGLWIGRDFGWLQTANGQNLYWPLTLMIVAAIFFFRQLGFNR